MKLPKACLFSLTVYNYCFFSESFDSTNENKDHFGFFQYGSITSTTQFLLTFANLSLLLFLIFDVHKLRFPELIEELKIILSWLHGLIL